MSFDGDLYPTAGATSVLTTKGDMVDFDTVRQRLAIGSANQILQVKSNLPSWETLSTAGSILTTQGDVLYESASGLARLGFGTSGDVLTTQGTGANPIWATPSGGGAYTELVNTTLGGAGNLTGSWVGTYRVLQIFVYASQSAGNPTGIRWNGDNSTNYNGYTTAGGWTGERSTDINNLSTAEFCWTNITVYNLDSEMKLITVTTTLSGASAGTAPTYFQSWNMWTNAVDTIQNCQIVDRNAGTLTNFATDSHLLVLGLN